MQMGEGGGVGIWGVVGGRRERFGEEKFQNPRPRDRCRGAFGGETLLLRSAQKVHFPYSRKDSEFYLSVKFPKTLHYHL